MRILFTVFLSTGLFCSLYAQRIENEDFSAFSVKISFSNDFIWKIESLRSYIEGYFFEGQGGDRMKALLVHNSYAAFKYMTEDQLSISLLPPDALGKKGKYDEYGYPDITIQKAIDVAASKYFFKLEVSYESMGLKHYYYVDSLLGPGQSVENIENNYLLPRITVKWDIYNKDGYVPIKSYTSNAVSKKPIPVKKCLMHGYLPPKYTGINRCETETLYEILELAVHDLIISVQADQ